MKFLLFVFFLILFSCAPKVEERCDPRTVLRNLPRTKAPENFKLHGYVKYGPLRFPFLFAKEKGSYRLKVAKAPRIRVFEDRFCLKGKCYLLPAPPEKVIFGELIFGGERASCEGSYVVLESSSDLYEKKVFFEGGKPVKAVVKNLKNGRTFTVLFRERDKRGFFRELVFKGKGGSVKLLIEEVYF